jgi:hypothetical protein
MNNCFEVLNKINVNDHIEKKGGFSYLSWPYAVAELRKHHPDATWEVKRFNGLPYLQTPMGYFVEVEVIVNGIPMNQIHPVLDNRNQVIKEPNVFHINTSIQRCLVKAIALHGLGLYIYAGEDLPMDEEPQETPKKPIQSASTPSKPQPPAPKQNYVKQAVEKFVEQEQVQAEKEAVNMMTEEEIRAVFGDDVEVVFEDRVLNEEEVKVVKRKINATGAFHEDKDTMKSNYTSLYQMIREQLNIPVNNNFDVPKIKVSDYERLIGWLDTKKDMFKKKAA